MTENLSVKSVTWTPLWCLARVSSSVPVKNIGRDSRATCVQLGCWATKIISGRSGWRQHMQTNIHMRWHFHKNSLSAALMRGGSYLNVRTSFMQHLWKKLFILLLNHQSLPAKFSHFLSLQSRVIFLSSIYNANVLKKCIKMSDLCYSSVSITL